MFIPPKPQNQTSNLQANESISQFVDQINSAFGVNFTTPNITSNSAPTPTPTTKPETTVTQQNNKNTNKNMEEDRKDLKEELEKNRREWMKREGIKENASPTKPIRRREPSLTELISSARSTINSTSVGPIYSMKGSDAIEYAKRSIGDMEQKMAQIAALTTSANIMDSGSGDSKQATNISNTARNNVQNITQVSADYLGSLRMSYETLPGWRINLG